MNKIDEIKWRLDNRTAKYHMPGQPADPVAHDDMLWMLDRLQEYKRLDQMVEKVIDDLELFDKRTI
jgi:hypothetical protein